jgi:UDP-glucose 4-epimerase
MGAKMHYLVTGGAGFIGGHLCERLIAGGHEVTILDDLSTGRYENVAGLDGNPKLRLVIDSVTHDRLVEDLVRGCDAVFHLASAVGVKLIMDRPVHVIETIFQGTDCVLRMASRYRKKVLLTSSSEVYGKSDQVPFDEDGDRLEGPTSKHRWAYACAKALDEFLALAHWKETRLPVVCVRLFNTVGPRQTGRYGMVVPRFVQAALCGEPIVVYGDGRQTRSFCHVLDVVDALIALMNCRAAEGKVVNVGSDQEVSIEELARRIVSVLGSSSAIRHVPYEQVYGGDFEDMQRRVPSLRRIGQLIGWRPTRDLDGILRDVADYIRRHMDGAAAC